jgi:hypothetical protein
MRKPFLLMVLLAGCSPTPEAVRDRLVSRLPAGWHTVSCRYRDTGTTTILHADACIGRGDQTMVFSVERWGAKSFEVVVRHQGIKHPNNPAVDDVVYRHSFENNGTEQTKLLRPSYGELMPLFGEKSRELYEAVASSY